MEISPLLLAKLLLYSFFLGIATGVLYDIFRIFRVICGAADVRIPRGKELSLKIPTTNRRVTARHDADKRGFFAHSVNFCCDFFTVIATCCGLLVLNYGYNDGKFRTFTVLGAFCGFLLYYFTVGKLALWVLGPVAFFVKYAFLSFFYILCYPFKFFAKIVIKNVRKIYKLCDFTLEKRRKKEYNINDKVFLLKMSKNGISTVLKDDKREREKSKKQKG